LTQDLAAVVAAAQPEELPGLIGQLEAAKAAAWARLVAPPSGPSPADDRLLTLPEAAKVLGITEHQAREMGRRGELPVIQVGERSVRIRAGALAEWMRRRENAGRGR